ncbi:MAG: EF-hand domain-containing protein [Sphingobium sp.]
MIRTLLLTSALFIASPALAQDALGQPPANDPSPANPLPGTSAEPAPAPEAAKPAAPANANDAVASIVNTEFPAYDANSDGQLDQSEFSRWMVALKDQEMKATGKAVPQDQVMAWASGAFTTADADKNVAVSKPELISYLSGGAG